MRAAAPIPRDERLFRRLKSEWVYGTRVLVEAIDTAGTSCDRELYRQPQDLFEDPEWPHVGWVTPELLPGNITLAGAPTAWEFFAVDLPEPYNEAHCEVRIRRVGQTSIENDAAIRKRDRLTRERLKSELASRFRVLPRSSAEAPA